MARRVLVTGMSGLIGGLLRRHLDGKDELRALNRRPTAGVPVHQADVADLDAIRAAFEGVDVVVHLAAAAGDPPWKDILSANVVGTDNVFEAARRARVRRVIYASSGATVSGYERERPYSDLAAGRYESVTTWRKLTHECAPRPSGLYGASTVWGEAVARHYADALSVICLRIGAVNREDRPLAPRQFSVWCSQRDVARMIDHARAVVGFEPLDRAKDPR